MKSVPPQRLVLLSVLAVILCVVAMVLLVYSGMRKPQSSGSSEKSTVSSSTRPVAVPEETGEPAKCSWCVK
ncbi:MAG: hypothetical protein JXD21_05865 [Candidatus Omnitrophica bacterium]|nr:hypothetical protein [Candidatus Omnitrophota bacterium]